MGQTTTPKRISPPIQALVSELVPGGKLSFIQVKPVGNLKSKDCFDAVKQCVSRMGGYLCYGWRIWEWPGVLVEGEFHAVWCDPAGVLSDVSTTPGGEKEILFLPDPDKRFEGRPINNVRRPLRSDPVIEAFIKACDAEFEILNRGKRPTQSGEIHLEPAEANEMAEIRRIKAGFWKEPPKPLPPLEPDAPCRCGSGLKFRKCCGIGGGLFSRMAQGLRSTRNKKD
jgi:hypothetical protein